MLYTRICHRLHIPILRPAFGGVFVLPFNTLLKIGPRVREEEAHAMTIAHSMGLPVPSVISYGDDGPGTDGSIWMTIVPGQPANQWWWFVSDEERSVFIHELDEYIVRMRQYSSPFSSAVSSVCGGPLKSHRACDGVIPRCNNETDFLAYLMSARWVGGFSKEQWKEDEEAILQLLTVKHPIVFTHGDLHLHNIIVKDGHISGIIDWECAGWMPDYWEFGVSLRVHPPTSEWYTHLRAITSFKYEMEMAADRVLARTTDQSYTY
ncbi:hypothetical protein QCA50_014926 [Cerrena zonata]